MRVRAEEKRDMGPTYVHAGPRRGDADGRC